MENQLYTVNYVDSLGRRPPKCRETKIYWKENYTNLAKAALRSNNEPLDLSKIVVEKKQETKEEIEQKFWQCVNQIKWCDRDERIIYHIPRPKINILDYIYLHIYTYINILKTKISNPLNLNPRQFEDMLGHVIMKGKSYYNEILEEPEKTYYISEKFQNTMDILKSSY